MTLLRCAQGTHPLAAEVDHQHEAAGVVRLHHRAAGTTPAALAAAGLRTASTCFMAPPRSVSVPALTLSAIFWICARWSAERSPITAALVSSRSFSIAARAGLGVLAASPPGPPACAWAFELQPASVTVPAMTATARADKNCLMETRIACVPEGFLG